MTNVAERENPITAEIRLAIETQISSCDDADAIRGRTFCDVGFTGTSGDVGKKIVLPNGRVFECVFDQSGPFNGGYWYSWTAREVTPVL